MSFITYKFRIKDATARKELNRMAGAVNYVWNYCNEVSSKNIKNNFRWFSAFDLGKLTAGSSKLLGISSRSLGQVCQEYCRKRDQFKKRRLGWRSKKKSLGWIPFDCETALIKNNHLRFYKLNYKFWKSREINGIFKSGSFNQDSRGRWYVNLVCEVLDQKGSGKNKIGIDLGLKSQITCSNGEVYSRENITKKYEVKLAKAQRANKKRLTTSIHAKIANLRKDWAHKTTTDIVKAMFLHRS